MQIPLTLGGRSEPEPDVAVVSGGPRDYLVSHPTSALLVVEIADTTVRFDRRDEGSLYARAGVLDYWIVNLVAAQLAIYRDPGPDATARRGYAYSTRLIGRPGDEISPLARPDARIKVNDLLP